MFIVYRFAIGPDCTGEPAEVIVYHDHAVGRWYARAPGWGSAWVTPAVAVRDVVSDWIHHGRPAPVARNALASYGCRWADASETYDLDQKERISLAVRDVLSVAGLGMPDVCVACEAAPTGPDGRAPFCPEHR